MGPGPPQATTVAGCPNPTWPSHLVLVLVPVPGPRAFPSLHPAGPLTPSPHEWQPLPVSVTPLSYVHGPASFSWTGPAFPWLPGWLDHGRHEKICVQISFQGICLNASFSSFFRRTGGRCRCVLGIGSTRCKPKLASPFCVVGTSATYAVKIYWWTPAKKIYILVEFPQKHNIHTHISVLPLR